MAGYGYTYRGGYTTYNGVAPQTDGWSKSSHTPDHVCRPVTIDAEGRRKPVVSYAPNGNSEYYVTKTEVVERVPFVTGYTQSTPVRVEVIRDYSPEKWDKSSSPVRYQWNRSSSPVRYHTEEKWNKPSSPVRYHTEPKWRPSSPIRYHVEEKWNRPSSPVRYHTEEKWNRPSSPVRYHAGNRPSSPVNERPPQVETFVTKIQNDASRPNKFAPLSANYWRQDDQAPNSYHVNTGYGDHGDLSNKEWQKPSGNTIRNEKYDNPYKRDGFLEPTITTTVGARTNPSHGAWSNGKGAKLSEPTSDISTAMETLKEAVKPSSGITPSSRYVIAAPTGPKRDTYTETIDSKEAERRFGNLNLAPRPKDNYSRIIDSREAARKYRGTTV
ncbi:hypothetical protein DITRI_Ditri06bG0155500 [Diplodiscus trichospermus]